MFQSEWDNLNTNLTNVTGSNVANSAADIILQEQKQGASSSVQRTLPTFDRTKERSLKVDRPTVLSPKIIYKRTGPIFPEAAVLTPPDNNEEYLLLAKEHLVWFLCRSMLNYVSTPIYMLTFNMSVKIQNCYNLKQLTIIVYMTKYAFTGTEPLSFLTSFFYWNRAPLIPNILFLLEQSPSHS